MAQINIKQIYGASQGSILFLGAGSNVSENYTNLNWDNNSQLLTIIGTVSTGGFQLTTGAQSGYILSSDSLGNSFWTASGTSGTSGSDGTSGSNGISGSGGTSGSSGTSGLTGTSGTAGTSGQNGFSSNLYLYKADTGSQAPPVAAARVKWDNATQISSTQIIVSHLTDDGNDVETFLALTPAGSALIIQDQNNSANFQNWLITGLTVSANAHVIFNCTYVGGGYSFSNNHALILAVQNVGPSGSSGTSGSNGTSGINGSTGVSGTSGTSGISPSVIGSDNQVLTSDGLGGITSESNLVFDGNSLLVTDAVGTQNYGIRLDSTQNTQFFYTGAIIQNTGGSTTSTLIGASTTVQGGQLDTIGIQSTVLGTSGEGIGMQILNSINNNQPSQWGLKIDVDGVEPSQTTPLPPYVTEKYGTSIAVQGDALTNTGISASVRDGHVENTGIKISVEGSAGAGVGVNVLNNISNTGIDQYGELIEVSGIEVPLFEDPFGSNKFGSHISVSGAANINTGLYISVGGARGNFAIMAASGSSIFNSDGNQDSYFQIKGSGAGADLFSTDPHRNTVGIGTTQPLTKLDVLGDYRFLHNPNVELPIDSFITPSFPLDPSGYGDIVTFGDIGSGFAAGLVCYLDGASNQWIPTNPTSLNSTRLIALALGLTPADGMLIRGYAQYIHFENAPFNLGEPLYLSYTSQVPPLPDIVGIMSNTAPTGVGEVVRIVGYCVGDIATYDRIYFNPDNYWHVV